jgi:hypothetical protein
MWKNRYFSHVLPVIISTKCAKSLASKRPPAAQPGAISSQRNNHDQAHSSGSRRAGLHRAPARGVRNRAPLGNSAGATKPEVRSMPIWGQRSLTIFASDKPSRLGIVTSVKSARNHPHSAQSQMRFPCDGTRCRSGRNPARLGACRARERRPPNSGTRGGTPPSSGQTARSRRSSPPRTASPRAQSSGARAGHASRNSGCYWKRLSLSTR